MGATRFTISAMHDGVTLLAFLKEKTKASSSLIKSALDLGACRVSGTIERFGMLALKKGYTLKIDLDFQARVEANRPKKPSVLYEDESIVLINKPAGLAINLESVQPFFSYPVFLVHRLDKGTTGCLCLAKTKGSLKLMEESFKQKKMFKTYLAISSGVLKKDKFVFSSCLVKDKSFTGQTLYKSMHNASYTNATTHVQKMKGGSKHFNALWCKIETGKTHQIRVHLKEKGLPIVGDLLYARQSKYPIEVKNMMLHAYKLSFAHPITNIVIDSVAPIPSYFKTFL